MSGANAPYRCSTGSDRPQEVVVVEGARAGWTSRVSRRSALTLPVVVGMAGCTQQGSSSNDPYAQALRQDPMFSWKPPMAVNSAGRVPVPHLWALPRRDHVRVVISLTPRDKELVHDLLRASVDAMAQAGYSDKTPGLDGTRHGGRVNGQDFWIECQVSSTRRSSWDGRRARATACWSSSSQARTQRHEPRDP